MNNSPDTIRKRPKPTDFQIRLLGKYRLLTSVLAVILGTIIIIKGIMFRGALPPILIGVCLCGLGISRLWIFTTKIIAGKDSLSAAKTVNKEERS